MNSSKILFWASYTVWTHCDINSCERKKVVIHDVAHCDLILCYVYAMKVISVKWHQVSHTTDSVLLSWLHCSSPSRVPIRPGKSHYICKLLGWLFILLRYWSWVSDFCPNSQAGFGSRKVFVKTLLGQYTICFVAFSISAAQNNNCDSLENWYDIQFFC